MLGGYKRIEKMLYSLDKEKTSRFSQGKKRKGPEIQ